MIKKLLIVLILIGQGKLYSQTTRSYDKNENKVFTSLLEALRQRDRVYHLKLEDQSLTTLPKELELFENLKTLDLSRNKISDLSSIDFQKISKLERINLFDNNLRAIPKELFGLTKLRELNLGSNQIWEVNIPEGSWKYIESIKLQHNKIYDWPTNNSFKYLKELRLDGNKLDALPIALFEDNKKLEILSVNHNSLKKLPDLNATQNLRRLDIGSNSLEAYDWLKSFTVLEELIMDWNQLDETSLEIIFSLKSLEILSLEHCGITEIPNSIGNLSRLTQLSLINNGLGALPYSIKELKRLEQLWIKGNEIDYKKLSFQVKNLKRLEIRS